MSNNTTIPQRTPDHPISGVFERVVPSASEGDRDKLAIAAANNNAEPISLTDLAALSGIDEDMLLQRLAGILNRRKEDQNA